ncbi:MAG: hypothetical protein DWQ35_04370 [Planctomycetota bacterium]|nr:MAG: hypothetical protein DWQ35_04370 [Planctomycetota bacterium]REK21728.1 MAG: hypothetical protein DWQ42_18795 [Planctomycetota bacterium]REK43134.1 MAG: hypothetical protein DWQ46_12240 [Planctomycetota bacterium]
MQVAEQVDAKKEKIGPAAAAKLARGVDQLYVAKGKSVKHLSLKKDKPSDADLKKLLIGPSGNLRAPTLRKGKKLLVGFHEQTYAEELS